MPGYIKKLQKYKHQNPSKPQYTPYPTAPFKYGAAPQEPITYDTSPPATKYEIKHIQKVVGSILYYALSVDLTVLMALSAITIKQAKTTKTTIKHVNQVLYYLATNLDATTIFHASEMILNIHSDASQLYAKSSKSRASDHLLLGSIPKYGESI